MNPLKSVALRLCLVLLGMTALATGANNPEEIGMESIRAEGIRAHVEFLADDLLEGRGTGTRGYDLAAKYVAAQFEAVGLEPASENGSYFQPVRFRSVAIAPDASIRLTRNGTEETLLYGDDFFGMGDPTQPTASISGEVVYLGYGVTAPQFGIDDYKGIDVHGKIVTFLPNANGTLPPTERAHFGNEQDKLANAAAHGAIGAIRLRDVETEKVQPYSRILRNSVMPTMAWIGPNGALNGQRKAIATLAVFSLAGTKKLFGGPTPDKPTVLPISASIRVISKHSEVTSPNVVAVLRGSDPRLRNEYLIYSAHIDHLGIGTPVNGDAIYNGARDNASGAAALIEIARAFKQLKSGPRRSVIFLGPTAEEKGMLGSDYFAEYPTVPRSQIIADINIDGLSVLYNARDVVVVGAEHSNLGEMTSKAAAITGLEATTDPQPEQNWFRRSDQYSFVRRGIPALFLRMGTKDVNPQIDALNLSDQWYATRYHMPSDDLNQPLNWESGARHARFAFVVGYLIAQQDAKPRWNKGDFFGRTFGGNR